MRRSRPHRAYESVGHALQSVIAQLEGFTAQWRGGEETVRMAGFLESVRNLCWQVSGDKTIDHATIDHATVRQRLWVLADRCPPAVAHLRERLERMMAEFETTSRHQRRKA